MRKESVLLYLSVLDGVLTGKKLEEVKEKAAELYCRYVQSHSTMRMWALMAAVLVAGKLAGVDITENQVSRAFGSASVEWVRVARDMERELATAPWRSS